MVALYLFCAALGIPLLALFAFGGQDADADAGFDADADFGTDIDIGGDGDFDLGGADGGIGDLSALFRRIPVSSWAFLLSFFGGVGLIGTAVGGGVVSTFVLAAVLGVLAATMNGSAFAFLRKTDASKHFADQKLEGRLATVSVPIEAGKRGRVWLDTGEERVQLSARAIEGQPGEPFIRGERVLIVNVQEGVAEIMRTDPELST
jgi:membrane protein implicated in regulation of membrane protease activity